MPKDIEYTEIGKDSISSKTFKQLEKTLLGKPLLEKIKPRIIGFYLENESLPYSFLESVQLTVSDPNPSGKKPSLK